MPPFVLTVLKIVFLAFLYFFVYRALRSVVVDHNDRHEGGRRVRGHPREPRINQTTKR